MRENTYSSHSSLGDVETRKVTASWAVGSGVEHQQMGNSWTSSDKIVSLSMGGVLNVFDPREGAGPVKEIHVSWWIHAHADWNALTNFSIRARKKLLHPLPL